MFLARALPLSEPPYDLLGDDKRRLGDGGLSSCSARISTRVNRVTTSEITPPVAAVEAALAAARASTISCA